MHRSSRMKARLLTAEPEKAASWEFSCVVVHVLALSFAGVLLLTRMQPQQGAETIASQSGVFLASVARAIGTCPSVTGGTCFTKECDSVRGNSSCTSTLTAFGFDWWRSCNCHEPTPCSHHDGACYTTPEADSVLKQYLKKDSDLIVTLGLIPLARGGALSWITSLLGLDRMFTVRPVDPLTIEFTFEATEWQQLANEHFKSHCQAGFVSVVKAACFHGAQFALFALPYYTYVEFMGPLQRTHARIVLAKEFWYLILIILGSIFSPSFLLFPSFSEADFKKRLQYFLDPEVFIAQCISRQEVTKSFEANTFCSLTILVSGAGGISAWIAMAAGFYDRGAMFPSLFVGYVIAGMAPLVIPIAFAAGSLKPLCRKLRACCKTACDSVFDFIELVLDFRIRVPDEPPPCLMHALFGVLVVVAAVALVATFVYSLIKG